MRGAVYYSNRDVRVEELPVPQIGPGEMLVQVEASGLCGSDVMEWYRAPRAPLVLGHEISGSVAACGDGVERYKVGDRITAAHHVPCYTCHRCANGHHTLCETLRNSSFDPGGFAEFIRLSPIHVERGVFPLPDSLSYEEATFVEPLACVVRGQQAARLLRGQTVMVVGSGIAGILHIKLARDAGAGRILATDIDEYRLEAARRSGADVVISAGEGLPDRAREVNGGRLADVVIVCTGAGPAIADALASVEPGGTVLLFAPSAPDFALPLRLNDLFWRTDVTITTSYGASPDDYASALELIGAGRVQVRDMITHRLGLSEAGDGFRIVAEARQSLKVILDHRR